MNDNESPKTWSIDTLVNSFLPDRAEHWDAAIAAQGIPLKRRSASDDTFASADEFIERMDELSVRSVLLVTGEKNMDSLHAAVSSVTADMGECSALADEYPGRIHGLWSINPEQGWTGVQKARAALDSGNIAGLFIHTHSYDRRFDDRDYYPYYSLAAEVGVPVVMQAGMSGGRMPSECGHPFGIDRPAIYFPEVAFVLSHIGIPWEDSAIALSRKFSNVYIGTGSYPPRLWPDPFVDYIRGSGRSKVLFASNFPTVGIRQALGELEDMGLETDVYESIVRDNALKVFTRLA